jgi:hypothetical protein
LVPTKDNCNLFISSAASLPCCRQTGFIDRRYPPGHGDAPTAGGLTMGIVMIRCPQTGREIPTGYEADPARFSASPVFFARSYCPLCRSEHEWFAQDAWVCEGAPARHRGTASRMTDALL